MRRYERELYGYLRRYLGDASLAEDVFQNTFLQLYTRIGTYEPGRPVRPWLYTIATHQAIDALRRAGRHQAVSLDRERMETSQGEFPNLSVVLESSAPGPMEQVEADERRQLVRAGVGCTVTVASSAAAVLGRGALALEIIDQPPNQAVLVTRKRQDPTPAARAFRDLAVERFAP